MTHPQNRLAGEKSPYLLQHAANPVDWYPWGEEAFARARNEDKPIFLSIGYSTCHWCHVMERESFESGEIAEILNRGYVSIKVDREERPDVDRVYMSAVQAMTGSGGWPLSAWLTPDLAPFYAGTYFPPRPRPGMPGFADLLLALSKAWEEERGKVLESAKGIVEVLKRATEPPAPRRAVDAKATRSGYLEIQRGFDPKLGGFTQAPKFPRPTVLGFLLHYHQARGEAQAKEMALFTLRRMWEGGMNDHLGGGFHRYSVDPYWRVPHFEKMLYDQAQLVWAYLDAHQTAADPFFAQAAREILDYVRRDLTDPEGGFFSAEDADSAPDPARPDDKQEGAFYLWGKDEMHDLLDRRQAELLVTLYGVSKVGNTINDPHGDFGTRNVLYAAHTLEEAARECAIEPEEALSVAAAGRAKLLAARTLRPRPHLDDKVITSWNGMMISAFARAFQVLGDPADLETARRAARSVLERNRHRGELKRRYRDGESAHPAHLDDYAALGLGLVDLYEAGAEIEWLTAAVELTEGMVDRFYDSERSGFFDAAAADTALLVRTKEGYDGAEPAGNSMAVHLLLRLGRMLDRRGWVALAGETLEAFGFQLDRLPSALPHMLSALLLAHSPARQIVLAGDPTDEASRELLSVVNRHYLPGRVLLYADGGPGQEYLASSVPFLKSVQPMEGRPTAYVCEHFSCKLPTSEPGELARQLERR